MKAPGERSTLVERPGHDPADRIAVGPAGPVTLESFERRVATLAARLPVGRHVVNLCEDRLHFLASFAAVIVSGQANLLPPNRQASSIRELLARYPDATVVHDGSLTGTSLPCAAVDVRPAANEARAEGMTGPTDELVVRRDPRRDPPAIDGDSLAVVSFTSGSTGEPRANGKSWSALVDGARLNAVAMLGDAPCALQLLATVPPQHMYGLELSVMLALRSDITVHTGQPLYPADVRDALAAMPAPRCLVTTPAHLRALLASGLEFPPVTRLFSATAPLSASTAAAAEQVFAGELVEIYGCSEVGSIARRRTATEDHWSLFDGFELERDTSADGSTTRVHAPHVGPPVALQDEIELLSPQRFLLRGRAGDLLNIAGKRGSLAMLNARLLEIPGVLDGVIFRPLPTFRHQDDARSSTLEPDPAGGDTRLVAIVVAPGLARSSIVNALRDSVDPVFLPRSVRYVESLPRQASSKLPDAVLQQLWRSLNGEQERRLV